MKGVVDMSTRKKMDYVVEVLESNGVKCRVHDYLFFFTLETIYNGRFLAFDVTRKGIHKTEASDLINQAESLCKVICGM